MKRWHGRLYATALLWVGCCITPSALAQLPARGEPIRTNDYSVDLYQGPVVTSVRVTGLAGAYVALAEGVDGVAQNPAAPAVRVPWSFDHFDYDLGFGVTFPTALNNTDFFNSGERTSVVSERDQDLLALSLAANLQFGTWGFGLSTDLQQYDLNQADGDDKLEGQFAVTHLVIARALYDGQLILGGGLRNTGLSIANATNDDPDETSFNTVGTGVEVGVLWRPNDQPFRIGASFHSEVTTQSDEGAAILYQGTPNELYLPERVTLPWDVNVGFALQFGDRPFNPRWLDPSVLLEPLERSLEQREEARQRRRDLQLARARARGADMKAAEAAIDAELETERALDQLHFENAKRTVDLQLRRRYARLGRQYLLVAASVVVTGPADGAVGIESFLQRRVDRSGEKVVVSPRLGLESELVPHWLKVRAGTYGEPTRFSSREASPRLHGTMGFDLKLFPWTVFGLFDDGTEWRVSGALDVSARYLGWGVSVGVWH